MAGTSLGEAYTIARQKFRIDAWKTPGFCYLFFRQCLVSEEGSECGRPS